MIEIIAQITALGLLALFVLTRTGTRLLEQRFPPNGRMVEVGLAEPVHIIERMTDDAHADRPPFILIHGASGNARDLDMALGDRLSKFARVMSTDRPGSGYSGRAESREASAPDHQAGRLLAALAELGIERTVLVGHSFGAAVATAAAVIAPHRVAGLILITPATHPWSGEGISWHNKVTAMPVIGWLFSRLFALPLGLILLPKFLPVVFEPNPVPKGYINMIGASLVLRPKSFQANARDLVDLAGHLKRLSPAYRQIAAPTLIIAGAEDDIVSNALHAEALAREIAGAHLIELRGIGHMPHWAARDETVRLISEFAVKKATAFTNEVDTGSREENAIIKKDRACEVNVNSPKML